MFSHRVGRGIALLFNDRGTRRGWVVSSTPRPHFTTGKDSVPILQEARWAGLEGRKISSHRDSIPDRPARSQSLYRLSYPAHTITYILDYNICIIHSTKYVGAQKPAFIRLVHKILPYHNIDVWGMVSWSLVDISIMQCHTAEDSNCASYPNLGLQSRILALGFPFKILYSFLVLQARYVPHPYIKNIW